MSARVSLVALLVVSTAAFVSGTSIERSSGGEAHAEPAGEAGERAGEAAESGEAAEQGGEAAESDGESLESTPLVAAAAAFSLALALAVWLRPGWRRLLLCVAIAMVAFALLDVRELAHQVDEQDTGLALLAAVVAGLHLAAAAVALLAPRDSLA
jgi:hypothetical protein